MSSIQFLIRLELPRSISDGDVHVSAQGDEVTSASSLAKATPRATKPRPVRVHKRNVRSLAR